MSNTFDVTQLPDAPIVYVTLEEDYKVERDIQYSNKAALEVIIASDVPVIVINEFRMKMTFDELLMGTQLVAVGDDALWRHPNISKVLLVTTDPTLYVAAAGLKSDTFGNMELGVYNSREAAINAAKHMLETA